MLTCMLPGAPSSRSHLHDLQWRAGEQGKASSDLLRLDSLDRCGLRTRMLICIFVKYWRWLASVQRVYQQT